MAGLSAPIDVRLLRRLRVFRIFQLSHCAADYRSRVTSLAASHRKIMVFVSFVVMVVLGTLMYVVEGTEHGFASIPVAVFWTISTMTTVGVGDLLPKTGIGRDATPAAVSPTSVRAACSMGNTPASAMPART